MGKKDNILRGWMSNIYLYLSTNRNWFTIGHS